MQNAGMKAKKAVKTQPKEDEDFNDSELFPGWRGGKRRAIRLKSLADVRRFLAATVNDLRNGATTESKAKTLGYLCSILKDVIQGSDLEQRIEKLEREVTKNEREF